MSSRRRRRAVSAAASAQMYLATALLPAPRTTDPAAATLRVRVSPDGNVTVEPMR